MTPNSMETYRGNCHCGRYRFELTVPKIKTAISCSCGICKKKGSLWLIPPAEAFRVIRDDGHLSVYQSHTIEDKFCDLCGTQVVGEHLRGPLAGQFLVNIRAVREPYVNLFQIEQDIRIVEGDDQQDTKPTADIPSDQSTQHRFTCHCGKVEAELLTPIKDQEIKEDNCSSCVRTGYIGVYPNKNQVRIHGRENGIEYKAGRGFSGVIHCKTCGVRVFSNVYGPPIGAFDRLPPEIKQAALELYHKNLQLLPLNIRAMEGVDLALLDVQRTDEGTDGYKLED